MASLQAWIAVHLIASALFLFGYGTHTVKPSGSHSLLAVVAQADADNPDVRVLGLHPVRHGLAAVEPELGWMAAEAAPAVLVERVEAVEVGPSRLKVEADAIAERVVQVRDDLRSSSSVVVSLVTVPARLRRTSSSLGRPAAVVIESGSVVRAHKVP